MTVEVLAINLEARTALLSDDRIVPITNLIAGDGDETNDPAEACAYVAKGGESQWFYGAVSAFDGQVH